MTCFPNTLYSHTWATISILSIGSCFFGKTGLWSIEITKIVCGLLRSPRLFVVFEITKIITFSLLWLCAYPSKCRGDCVLSCSYPSCVEVIMEESCVCWYPSKCRGDCGGVWLCAYPFSVRWLWLFGLVAIPLSVEVIVVVPCLLCIGCSLERGVVYF